MQTPFPKSGHSPHVVIPSIRVPNPDGSITIKAGRPVVVGDVVGCAEAARLLGVSRRWVAVQCDLGRFLSAYKPSGDGAGHWKLSRSEVLSRLGNTAAAFDASCPVRALARPIQRPP